MPPKYDDEKVWICPECGDGLVKSMVTEDLLRRVGAKVFVAPHGVMLVDSPWIAETEPPPMTDAEIESYQEPIGVCQHRVCYCYVIGDDAGKACHD